MSSTNKTTNLKLNKWIGTDRSAREDFNNDNDLIDKFAGEVTASLNEMEQNKAEKTDLQATNTELATQKARIDTFTKLAEGSTTGDAELIDGRILADKTYNNIGGAIRSIDDKIENKISLTQYSNWDELKSSSDTHIYITNFTYKKGYIKSITIKINGDVDQAGSVYIYKYEKNIVTYKGKLCDISGHGEIEIPIEKFISYTFLLGISASKLAYTAKDTNYNSGIVWGDETKVSTIRFDGNLVFGIAVNYAGVNTSIENINDHLLNKNNIVDILSNTLFPVIFDFENNLLKTDFFVLNNETKNYDYFKKELSLTITDNIWKTYSLLYDATKKEIYVGSWTDNNKVNNIYVISVVYTNNRHGYIFNANSDYVKLIIKPSFNTDDGTTTTGNVIPKFGERSIITREVQKNKWYGKVANFLGDSLTKGENPDDSYFRMKDDNIASVAKEEFGFITTRNYGIGGTTISGTDSSCFINRYSDMDNNADLIIVWGGTNDYYHGRDLGSLNDTTDNTKFIPALYNLLSGLQTKYPGKPLGVISPPHLYGADNKYKDNIARNGYKLIDLVNAMDDVCAELGIPFLNLYKEIGFTPHNSTLKSAYQPDGVHFNIAGSRNYSTRRICEFIKTL